MLSQDSGYPNAGMNTFSLRFFFGQIAVYGISDAIIKALSLVSVVIFSRIFSPSDYGTISLIASFVGVLNVLGGLGLSSALQRDYFAESGELRILAVSTGYWGLLGFTTLITFVGLIAAPGLAYLVFGSFEYWTLYAVALLTIPVVQGLAYCQDVIRVNFRPWRFSVVAIVNQLCQIAIGVSLVVWLSAGIYGLFAGMVLGGFAAFALGTFWIARELRPIFSLQLFRRFVAFGTPLVIGGLAFPAFMFLDRYILDHFQGKAAVGHFAIAASVTQTLVLISGSFSKAWNAIAWKLRHEHPQYRKLFADILLYLIAVFASIAVAVAAFAREIVGILAPSDFAEAAIAVAPLTVYMLANVSIQVTAAGISISGRTHYLIQIIWVAIAVNVLLDLALIPYFGILGAAVATAIAETGMSLAMAWVSQRLHPLPYDYRRIALCSLTFVIFLVMSYSLPNGDLVPNLVLKAAFVLLFPALLMALDILSWKRLRLTAEILTAQTSDDPVGDRALNGEKR